MSNPFRRKAQRPAVSPERLAQIQAARKAAHSMSRWNHTGQA